MVRVLPSRAVMDTTTDLANRTIDVLNVLLRDELAAIETYGVALHDRSAFSGKTELSRCQRSHETRAAALRDKIVALGGEPADGAGIAGAWGKVVEIGAAAISDEMAIRALEQNEEHVHRDYSTWIPNVTPEVRRFLEQKIWPEEETTYRAMSELKARLQAAH
jgi:hypothetical protein